MGYTFYNEILLYLNLKGPRTFELGKSWFQGLKNPSYLGGISFMMRLIFCLKLLKGQGPSNIYFE